MQKVDITSKRRRQDVSDDTVDEVTQRSQFLMERNFFLQPNMSLPTPAFSSSSYSSSVPILTEIKESFRITDIHEGLIIIKPVDPRFLDSNTIRHDLISLKDKLSEVLKFKYILVSNDQIKGVDKINLEMIKDSTSRIYISEDILKGFVSVDYLCERGSKYYNADVVALTEKSEQKLVMKVDTGASISCINMEGVNRGVVHVQTADGAEATKNTFFVEIKIHGLRPEAVVAIKMKRNLLGMDYLELKTLHCANKIMSIND